MNTPNPATLAVRDLGPLGTGSNMFRCGVAHSSGVVFVGTYGPPPAIVWKFDPATGELTEVGRPGEYQLDSMVEAPNGRVYIGTAYGGIVYELDPATLAIRDLGAPPVDSTPWVFTMMRTREGEIFGARGVGLFNLDWRTGAMTSCGVVPGDHKTPGLASAPITRTLEQRPDGLIWGDTNRWLFVFDPRTRETRLVADVLKTDGACYGVLHPLGRSPFNDLYFQAYARWAGKAPGHALYVCRAETGRIEPVDVEGVVWPYTVLSWRTDAQGEARLVVSQYDEATQTSELLMVDVIGRRVAERWEVPGRDTPPWHLAEGCERGWYVSMARGGVYRADAAAKRLVKVATNPVPAECRCLAMSPTGRLGTDTYDCGFAFTFDPDTRESIEHGRVWFDDHRCNFGPAAFAGVDGRFFVANHGEDPSVARLWVTDTLTHRHWRIGPESGAAQLVRLSDGTVWGTLGPNPPSIHFDPATCWHPAWIARPGTVFRYRAGEERVEVLAGLGESGPIAEIAAAGDGSQRVLLAAGRALRRVDAASLRVLGEARLDRPVVAAASDLARGRGYVVLEGGGVAVLDARAEGLKVLNELPFGGVECGCFVLPQTGRLVGVALDGTVSVLDPKSESVTTLVGSPPPPAGPAVHPRRDAWYYADQRLREYTL